MRPSVGLGTVDRVLIVWENLLHMLACLCVATMAGLITWDAISRAVFDHPMQIQFEMTEFFLMPMMALLSLAWIYRDGGHIALTLIDFRVFGQLQRLVEASVVALALIFFALVTWKSSEFVRDAWMRDDVYLGVVNWPLWFAYLAVPIGTGTLSLRLALELVAPALGPNNEVNATDKGENK